jgi:hypothetical protein
LSNDKLFKAEVKFISSDSKNVTVEKRDGKQTTVELKLSASLTKNMCKNNSPRNRTSPKLIRCRSDSSSGTNGYPPKLAGKKPYFIVNASDVRSSFQRCGKVRRVFQLYICHG